MEEESSGACSCDRLAREGVLLRRQWDRLSPAAPVRLEILCRLPAVQSAQVVAELAADPSGVMAAVEEGELDGLAELPEVKRYVEAFQDDPAMKEALRQGDVGAVMKSRHVRSMLTDRALHGALLAHRDELRRAVGRPEYARELSGVAERGSP